MKTTISQFSRKRKRTLHSEKTLLPNSVIYKLTAIDKDSGNNGRVVYKLKDFQKSEIYNLFAIGETTGELTVIGKLVYEPGKIYNIYIEASDKGDNPNVAQALVRVTVEDTGNNPPKITVNFFGQPSSDKEVEISENATVGHVVAYIDVEDQDTGANGEVSCSTYNTYFGLTSTQNAKGYNVIVQHVLDRETLPQHSVTISCRDKGTPRFEDTAKFIVKLRDVNDNQPRFSKHVYKDIRIYENNPIGMSIIQVTATDNDYGKNGEVRYAMYPSTDTRFKVHPLTGLITANMVFDRETSTHIRFEVIAVDSGLPNPLSSYASVLIDVLDRNDEKPDFVKAFFEFQLRENLPSGTTVGFVSATDNDEAESGSLVYSFPSGYKNNSIPFVVLSTGEIKTNQALNREDQSRYDFYVMAKDKGTPPLNSTAHVVVFVQDENDNKPQFIFPNKENYTITIPNTIPSDSIIATLQAYDVDDGENGNIMYFLKAGDNDGIFYLDHATGSLYVKKLMNILEDKRYNLLIQVTDRGSPVKVEEQSMVIVIKYTNVTTAPQHFEDSDRFVLIAVSVICVTFVLSMGLIAVICLLKRREEDKKKASVLFPVNRVPPTAPNLYDQAPPVTNNNYENTSLDINGRNKTKVSFSLDTENPKETFTKMQILEKYTGSMSQQQNKHTREESPSETSGETITSQDSGRGKTQTFEPLFVPGKDSHPSIYVIRQHSRNGRSDNPGKTNSLDKPLPQRQTSLQDHSQDSLLTTSFNSMWSEPSHHNLKNIGTLPTVPSISAWTGGLFYKDGTLGSHSAHSRDDDECTTTSGSYTINEDDLDLDFPTRPRDLFV
ncbi:hypothetical protein KUTeg_024484 [Tegillarca granosa]|uniref:Cadherin domain-containing protein n=1 Tax=Tegillarca granosa TaxID=220873 RepID=A0ABQ9DXG7_TEGGR|nr:hypothetical protein KUTeg_024484 [Tegillarca granosa]